jgi:hypothetical protein
VTICDVRIASRTNIASWQSYNCALESIDTEVLEGAGVGHGKGSKSAIGSTNSTTLDRITQDQLARILWLLISHVE